MLALLRFLRFGRRDLAKARQQNQQKQLQLQKTRKRLRSLEQQNKRMRRWLQQAEQRLEHHKERLPEHLARESLLRNMPKQSVCAEIGVGEGAFSKQILDAVSPRRLHLIDPWKHEEDDQNGSSRYGGLGSGGQAIMNQRYEKVRERFAGEIGADQVKMHRRFSTEISDEFEDSYFDWIYIDGNHTYKFVRQDLELYYPKVKPGGYITGADYGDQKRRENEVRKAVDEFVSQNLDFTLEVKGTQFILRKNERASDGLVASDRRIPKTRQATSESTAGTLPGFLLIGAQKCGTGFLFRLLSRHPNIEPAINKEVHFFSHYFNRSVDWYRSQFPSLPYEGGCKTLTWEASPYYLYHPRAARRAAEVVPRAKLLVLLRNPVDRAYSHYRHQVRMGHEPRSSFEEALEAEEERLRGKRERMLRDKHYSSVNVPRFSYISRGIYVDQLREWHEHFGKDRLLVIQSENLFAHTHENLAKILRFLDLPDWKPETVKCPTKKYSDEPMAPAVRERLEEYFEPHNQRLYEYLGTDFGW